MQPTHFSHVLALFERRVSMLLIWIDTLNKRAIKLNQYCIQCTICQFHWHFKQHRVLLAVEVCQIDFQGLTWFGILALLRNLIRKSWLDLHCVSKLFRNSNCYKLVWKQGIAWILSYGVNSSWTWNFKCNFESLVIRLTNWKSQLW